MARALPQEWLDGQRKSLSVSRDLGLRGDYPSTLTIYQVGKTKNLDWRYLPAEEDDPRPFAGRTNEGKGKRKYETGSTSTDDPWEAGKRAISASMTRRQTRSRELEGLRVDRVHALATYWETWITRQANRPRNNSVRWLRDKHLLWSGTNGIGHQSWATQKSIQHVTPQDFDDFFNQVTRHCLTKGRTGDETKRQYKTLIRHLYKEARRDFPFIRCPEFPSITRQIKAVKHLTHDEWDRLIGAIVGLSDGAALQDLSRTEYCDLQWSSRDRKNQRNWVDLYDAIHLQWFFYLRSEDAPRLKSEWFTEKDGRVSCYLEKTKGDRDLHQTFAYRPGAHSNTIRTLKRKPKGYIVLPWINRKEGSENQSNVGATLNHLLQYACIESGIPQEQVTWTTIRHTAFRLTLEDMPELGMTGNIRTFAENGHTSPQMLHDRYLRFIEREKIAKLAEKRIARGKWDLTTRTTL